MQASDSRIAVLIPAYNEEGRIGRVVSVARRVGYVLVVDDGSKDNTAAEAASAGAAVFLLPDNMGKFAAVKNGIRRLKHFDVVILLDADLTGLKEEHLWQLAGPVLMGDYDSTVGVLIGGRIATHLSNVVAPGLSGQRCFRRELFDEFFEEGEYEGYGLEEGLNRYMDQKGIRNMFVKLQGVGQIMKEEKYGLLRGVRMRMKMYADILRVKLSSGGEE